MSIFKEMKTRQLQRKSNDFIRTLSNKSDKDIEQIYLDNKEFEDSEIVLSYLFFNHPSLIRILPLEFQKSRLNSNLNMFHYGSTEAKRALVSSWLHENKFFMNSLVVELDDEEYNSYIKMYFNQPEDVAILYMDDLERVVTILTNSDIKATERVINVIKDKLTDKQWEYIIKVNPLYIQYASQTIQNKYASDERYTMYINGDARDSYIKNQLAKVRDDLTLLSTMSIDVQKEYILAHPYMISHIDEATLVELLKYDIDLIRYVNMPALRSKEDKSQEVLYGILENVDNKSIKDIVNMFVDKCVLNAKGKLYRFDNKSNNISYQYTKRLMKIIQTLNLEQIKMLLAIDVNYVLPYVVPVYNDETDRKLKESIIIDCNSRCLNLFESYYGSEVYENFYKVINKIYNEFLANLDKYDYTKDYDCIFELLKVLFNKKIIQNNSKEKISVFIGMSLFYKDSDKKGTKETSIKLLNELLENAYNVKINNDKHIYDLYSLEIFDERFSFINNDLLHDFNQYNFVNMSTLLFYIKSDRVRRLFQKYYEILTEIYGENKEILFKSVENFTYYRDLLKSIDEKELTDKETTNLINVLSTFGNYMNITKKEELNTYEINLLKKLITDLSEVKDEAVYKNLLCRYLFNKNYDQKGNSGWLDTDTLEQIFDVYDDDSLISIEIDNKRVFSEEEINLYRFAKLLFNTDDFGIILSFIDNIIAKKIKINYASIGELFTKLKKYRTEIINEQIVTIDDIELMFIDRPDVVNKRIEDGVSIYTIINQDFKVLCANVDDGIHYTCTNVSDLEKNSYGYNNLIKNGSVRFTTYDGKTIIKINKDNKVSHLMKAKFIIVVGKLTSELIKIAKNNHLKIVEVQDED
ncbi:MAG: hypothetical protein IJ966_07375 [Bacilli bacterium]|nr:hypothetical protein [Bacilli bacterium]